MSSVSGILETNITFEEFRIQSLDSNELLPSCGQGAVISNNNNCPHTPSTSPCSSSTPSVQYQASLGEPSFHSNCTSTEELLSGRLSGTHEATSPSHGQMSNLKRPVVDYTSTTWTNSRSQVGRIKMEATGFTMDDPLQTHGLDMAFLDLGNPSPLEWSELSSGSDAFSSGSLESFDDMKVLGVDLETLMNEDRSGSNCSSLGQTLPSKSLSNIDDLDHHTMKFQVSSSITHSVPDTTNLSYVQEAEALALTTTSSQENHHMACHDYTNKVSYSSLSSHTQYPLIHTSNSSRARTITTTTSTQLSIGPQLNPPNRVVGVARPTRSSMNTRGKRNFLPGCGFPKRGCRGPRRIRELRNEDKDYLAHGTGIPRYSIWLWLTLSPAHSW